MSKRARGLTAGKAVAKQRKNAVAQPRRSVVAKPRQPSSSFEDRLVDRGLLPSTRDKYTEISERMETSDPVRWLRSQIHARTPIGTVLPLRAVVKHYLIGELGYTDEECAELLPKATGRATRRRHALTPNQLAVYHIAVERIDAEPARTILMLLPQTGLRISEACGLHARNFQVIDERTVLVLRGKGDKERMVPLNRAAETTLERYQETHGRSSGWLFPGRDLPGVAARPIGPHAIRKYTRAIAEDYPSELEALSPHILRHTFATMALRSGMNLSVLQKLLGHESILTTERYLHPTASDLIAAIDLLD